MPVAVSIIHRPVLAVREHIIPEEARSGACVAVCIEEPLDDRIIVSALQVIEAGLYLQEVAPRSKNGLFQSTK